MVEKYLPYGIAGIINSADSEKEIRLFLSKYKQWYIKTLNLSKNEAENHIKMDIRFYINKFIRNEDLANKLSAVVALVYS
jgi:hypothetical protein